MSVKKLKKLKKQLIFKIFKKVNIFCKSLIIFQNDLYFWHPYQSLIWYLV